MHRQVGAVGRELGADSAETVVLPPCHAACRVAAGCEDSERWLVRQRREEVQDLKQNEAGSRVQHSQE